MAKFTGKDQTLTFNGATAGTDYCITSADYSMSADTFTAACAGSSTKTHVVGQTTATVTINGLVESQKLDDLFGAAGDFLVGANAADYDHRPEGTAASNDKITSTSATVGTTTVSVPVEGLCAFTAEILFDNYAIAVQ